MATRAWPWHPSGWFLIATPIPPHPALRATFPREGGRPLGSPLLRVCRVVRKGPETGGIDRLAGQPQYASAEMISPPLRVPRAHQALRPIESLMNRTEPSQKAVLTPPGWLLEGFMALSPSWQRKVLLA